MGITEIVSGTLRGAGCEAICTLLVTRSGQRRPAYTLCTVLRSPDWLPDGYYEASFDDQTAFLRRRLGAWSTGTPWADVGSSREGSSRSGVRQARAPRYGFNI